MGENGAMRVKSGADRWQLKWGNRVSFISAVLVTALAFGS